MKSENYFQKNNSFSWDALPRFVSGTFIVGCLILGVIVLLSLLFTAFEPSLIQNFTRPFNDNFLSTSIKNTLVLFFLATIFQISIVIIISIYFQYISNWIKILFLVPFAMGVVAPAFSINVLLGSSIGPFQTDLLGTISGARLVIIIIDTWQWTGILLLASYLKLELIPKSYYEQSKLEGISNIKRWWYISWPEIQNILLLYISIRFIDWIRKVDAIKAVFGKEGGPGNVGETIGLYIIKAYYQISNKGYSSALSLIQIIFLGLILSVTIKFFIRYLNLNKRNLS